MNCEYHHFSCSALHFRHIRATPRHRHQNIEVCLIWLSLSCTLLHQFKECSSFAFVWSVQHVPAALPYSFCTSAHLVQHKFFADLHSVKWKCNCSAAVRRCPCVGRRRYGRYSVWNIDHSRNEMMVVLFWNHGVVRCSWRWSCKPQHSGRPPWVAF